MSNGLGVKIVACITILMCGTAWPCAGGSDVAADYAKLEKLAEKGLKQGWTPQSKQEARTLKNCFVENGLSSVPYLLGRLNQIVQEDGQPGMDRDWASMTRTNVRQGPLKYLLAVILASSYSRADDADKEKILETLKSMYTPSSYHPTDLLGLNWAVLSIGKDAVRIFFELADHPNRVVRCSMQDTLDSISEEISKTAPRLDCKQPLESQEQQLQSWWQWWIDVGSKTKFPSFPEPFPAE